MHRQAAGAALLLCAVSLCESFSVTRRPALRMGLEPSRRDVARRGVEAALAVVLSGPASAFAARGDEDDDALMDVLAKDGFKAYKQYWPALQLAADFYVFEMEPLVREPAKWAKFEDLFRESAARGGQGQPSRIEREFISPMRMMTTTFPEPDAMQLAQQDFSKHMRAIQKKTIGYSAGDIPPEAVQKEVSVAFDQGRDSLNAFLLGINDATGASRMVAIPKDYAAYPRSKSRYLELKRNLAKCQNRGGEALAGIWGQLMVYGTTGVSPCGDINLSNYFDQ